MITPNTLLQNRYLVQKQVGKGGMGVVYMATDQRFGSTVALKEIKETIVDKPHLLKAFEREARLLNHLKHPALPRVSDHFTEEDGQFLVMEFIPGADLSEMLKERGVPFSRVRVLEWADQLLDALDYLHTHEPIVIHRDIKPQNLKLTARDRIMLLDFGLAKGAPLHAQQMTATGSLFGYSFNYAPLEQMQGTGTDPRSDLYSLGATLYHLMTNVTPPDALTRATAVLNGEPDPLRPANEVQAQVTAPVARVIERAMALNAAQRPQTAAEMREALRDASREVAASGIHAVAAPSSEAQSQKQGKLTGAMSATPAIGAATNEKKASSHTGSYDDMTVIEPAPSKRGLPPSVVRKHGGSSVITKMTPYEPPASRPSRALGIVMGVVLIAVVVAVVYTFTRPSTETPSVQTVPSPVDPALPTPTAVVETQTPSNPSSVPSSQQTSNPLSDSAQSQPAPASANPQPVAAENNAAATQPNTQTTTTGPNSNPTALTPEEERARKADEIRRERREKDEAEMRRQRDALEEERRRERERMDMERRERERRPPPPGGFPPPRRDGPPPPY